MVNSPPDQQPTPYMWVKGPEYPCVAQLSLPVTTEYLCLAKDELAFLPLSPGCWDCRHVLLCPGYDMLRMEPRASYMQGEHTIDWTPRPVLGTIHSGPW